MIDIFFYKQAFLDIFLLFAYFELPVGIHYLLLIKPDFSHVSLYTFSEQKEVKNS